MTAFGTIGLLFAAAAALVFAAYWQERWAKRMRRIFDGLTRTGCRDPERWPHEAWPWLQQAGVVGLSWQGEWLGQPQNGTLGTLTASHWQEDIVLGSDLKLSVRATLAHRRGEQAWLARASLALFTLLWRQRGMEDLARLEAAIVRHGRRGLALLHQMRNLAQWLLWNAESFTAAHSDAELITAARAWQRQAPLVAARAQAILRYDRQVQALRAEDLAAQVQASAALHGVKLEIVGAARAPLPESVCWEIFDNLFIDLRQHLGAEASARLELDADTAELKATLILPQPDFAGQLPRLFVPFASGRPGGLGVGLYLARRAARAVGGELEAQEQPARFLLRLPLSTNSTSQNLPTP